MGCDKCYDSGYIVQPGTKIFSGFCSCARGVTVQREMWEQAQKKANIPRDYWHKEIEDLYPQTNPLHQSFVARVARNVSTVSAVHNTSACWAIFGDSGCGKTMGGILVLRAALRKGYSSYYTTWSEFMDDRLNGDKAEERLLDKIKDKDFLCMDKVGQDAIRDDSKFPNETLTMLLGHRYENRKPTILLLSDTFDTTTRKLPILRDIVSHSAITEVRGLNYRLK